MNQHIALEITLNYAYKSHLKHGNDNFTSETHRTKNTENILIFIPFMQMYGTMCVLLKKKDAYFRREHNPISWM